jgi:hypothetical protein
MAQVREYRCTRCGTIPEVPENMPDLSPRDFLTVKKILFVEMGAGGRSLRSRVAEWLCPPCVAADPDWNLRSKEED